MFDKEENYPKVTVVTITYNLIENGRKDYIIQNIESVHNQTYKNFEHIIIDGASDDGTLELLKPYEEKGWIKIFSEPDNGIYNAMNKGINKAEGEIIAFLNSDDFYNNKKGIYATINALTKTNADFAYSACKYLGKNDKIDGILYPKPECFYVRMPFSHQTLFCKTAKMKELNCFNEKYKSAGDYDFVIRLFLSKAQGCEVPLNFVSYRLNGISYNNQEQSIEEITQAYKENFKKFCNDENFNWERMYPKAIVNEVMFNGIVQNVNPIYAKKMLEYWKNENEYTKNKSAKKLKNFRKYIKPNDKKFHFNIPFIQNVLDKISGKKRYNTICEKANKINLEVDKTKKSVLTHIKNNQLYQQIYMMALGTHSKVFPKYRNCNLGKELVIIASGPTMDYYTAQENKLFLGVNKSFLAGKADLDYLFVQDYFDDVQNLIDEYKGNNCQKFYGIHYCVPAIAQFHADRANAERYYFIDCNRNGAWAFPPDISILPFNTYSSVVHPAITFALWTGVSKIYLVGCDTSNAGYSQKLPDANKSNPLCVDNVLYGWEKMKEYASTFYPKTEIISINPVGLRGLFKDVYTKNYLADHPELIEELGDDIEILEERIKVNV